MTRRARLLALALLAASSAGAQLIRVPPVRTVATLGACTDGSPKIVAVTDGATASDCATGAGTYDVTCYCANGAWAASATASGTVTTFSVVTANGVSASVANATTTPAATFTLGAITPSSVASVGAVTGSNLSGTNTGDQTNISGNAATATALQATLGVSGGGTGATSLTAYAPVCGGTTTTGAVQSCSSGIGTSGYVLTSNGASALPTWQAAAGGGGVAGSDTQVTFNDAGTAAGDAGLTYNKTTDGLELVGRFRLQSTASSAQHVSITNCENTLMAPHISESRLCVMRGDPAGEAGDYYSGIEARAFHLQLSSAFGGGQDYVSAFLGEDSSNGFTALMLGAYTTLKFDSGAAAGANFQTGAARDVAFYRDGSHTLAIRDPVDPGGVAALRIYTYVPHLLSFPLATTNYERLSFSGVVGTKLTIAAETGGTGADDLDLELLPTGAGSVLLGGPPRLADPGTRPTCDSAHRGTVWYDAGGSGVADTFEVCTKDAAAAYAWRTAI